MAIKVLVPRLGEGVEEVTVTKWLKQVGELIAELDPLLEVNTDKVDTEIPAPAPGIILSIHILEGSVARVGDLLAVIGEENEQSVETQSPAHETPPAPSKPTVSTLMISDKKQSQPQDLGFISPLVSKMATEFGIDLTQVAGTGLGGRITKNDILAFIDNKRSTSTAVEAPLILSPQPDSIKSSVQIAGDRLIKHSLMRKSIAEHMLASKRTSPHVLTVMEVDMSRVVAHRITNKALFARDGVNLTFTAYFLSAVVAGLKAYPLANSSWSDEGVIIHAGIHLGMATSLGEDGLIVPVIKGSDGLSLLGMARTVNDLSTRARAKKLHPDEVKGGTFTLTNHGVSGSILAMPIINQPQCGILGVGAMQKRVVVVTDGLGNDVIAIRPMVYLSYVFDHRILDGASADWFLAKVKDTLENWSD
jgi:pyruvate/2-oxoglutarate dehydrogenase complex dihydrolipoamide acyltransferase (E2) component